LGSGGCCSCACRITPILEYDGYTADRVERRWRVLCRRCCGSGWDRCIVLGRVCLGPFCSESCFLRYGWRGVEEVWVCEKRNPAVLVAA
jgi:hypothetical protein